MSEKRNISVNDRNIGEWLSEIDFSEVNSREEKVITLYDRVNDALQKEAWGVNLLNMLWIAGPVTLIALGAVLAN